MNIFDFSFFFCRPRIWHEGLKKVIKKLKEVMNTVDKRTIWLKNNYVQQYIISAGRGPMTADAIRVSDTNCSNNIECMYTMSCRYRIAFNDDLK